MLKKHQQRAEKVQHFIGKHKLFLIMAIIAGAFLFGNYLAQPNVQPQTSKYEYSDYYSNEAVVEFERELWRFYWIDVVILIAGGGFCVLMLLRERRRLRNKI